MPNGDDVQMQKAKMKSHALAQQQQQSGTFGTWTPAPKRDEYANQVTIERRDHDAVLRFHLQGEDYSTLVREVTVPLGALEGLT